jgi:hypothetical protein
MFSSSSSPSLFPQQQNQQHQQQLQQLQQQQQQQNSGFSVYNILNSAAAAAAVNSIEQQQAVYLNGTQIDWQPHSNNNNKLYNSYKQQLNNTDTDSQPYHSTTSIPEQTIYNDFYIKSKRYVLKISLCVCVLL